VAVNENLGTVYLTDVDGRVHVVTNQRIPTTVADVVTNLTAPQARYATIDPNKDEVWVSYLHTDAGGARVPIVAPIDASNTFLGGRLVTVGTANQQVYDLAYNERNGLLYVAVADNVVIVDPGTGNTLPPISGSGQQRHGVAVNPNTNMIYVTNRAANTVDMIDGATNGVIKTIPVGSGPEGIAVDRDHDRIYVVNVRSSSISIIDGPSSAVIGTLTLNLAGPRQAAVDPVNGRLYIPNFNNGTFVTTVP